MSPVGGILLRNLHGIETHDHVFWINPPADDSWRAVNDQASGMSAWCQDYTEFQQLNAGGAPVTFGDFPQATPQNTRHFILTLPRSKERLGMQLDFICSVMAPGSRLWLAGENQAGIKSSPRLLRQRFNEVRKLDNARHCTLFEARDPVAGTPFTPGDYAVEWTMPEELGCFPVCSLPGVFAHGKLDPGTRLLLEQLPSSKIHGSVLDFGCGCGLVSARLGMLFPETRICMVDIDALALTSSSMTMVRNARAAEIFPHNGLQGLNRRFDLIVSNPPFHHGTRTDMELGMSLLDGIRNFLNPGGQLMMVGNCHLPYRRWLDGLFGKHRVLASNSQFQVLNAVQSG